MDSKFQSNPVHVYGNATYAFVNRLDWLMNAGKEITVRGQKTKELLNQHFTILRPLERCYVLPHRNDNIFAKIAESMWVMAGRNDMEFLSHYLPRAKQWSDDGLTWRAAYGARLRHWRSRYEYVAVDQVRAVANLLRNDPTSRQAVMSIFDPDIDYEPGKDIPCNNWIQFIIRPNASDIDELHMVVAQRSSDILWGFSGINTFEWSILHQMMSTWAGVITGSLTYAITSLHVYEQFWPRCHGIVDDFSYQTMYDLAQLDRLEFTTDLDDLDTKMDAFMTEEKSIREDPFKYHNDNKIWAIPEVGDPLLDACLHMLLIYNVGLSDGTKGNVAIAVSDLIFMLPKCDFRVAAAEYYVRRWGLSYIDSCGLPREDIAILNKLMAWSK